MKQRRSGGARTSVRQMNLRELDGCADALWADGGGGGEIALEMALLQLDGNAGRQVRRQRAFPKAGCDDCQFCTGGVWRRAGRSIDVYLVGNSIDVEGQ